MKNFCKNCKHLAFEDCGLYFGDDDIRPVCTKDYDKEINLGAICDIDSFEPTYRINPNFFFYGLMILGLGVPMWVFAARIVFNIIGRLVQK